MSSVGSRELVGVAFVRKQLVLPLYRTASLSSPTAGHC